MICANALTNKEAVLQEICQDLARGYFCIPNFQRGVVWKSPDVCKLADSLIWGYPISSLLLMPTSGPLNVGLKPMAFSNAKVAGVDDATTGPASYVLDGQQRLTAIASLFLDDASDRVYYYDLLTILVNGFEDVSKLPPHVAAAGGILGVACEVRGNPGLTLGEYACRSYKAASNGEVPDTKESHRYVRCKAVLESGFGKYINKFLRNYFTTPDGGDAEDQLCDTFTDYLTGLLGGLKSYGIPVTIISDRADLELVCSVFERVNSSGIKLTAFDLVNAKTFEASGHGEGLSKFLSDRMSSSAAAGHLANFFGGSSFKDLARAIRILYTADKLKKGQLPDLTNASMLRQKADFWFNAWTSAESTLIEFIQWAECSGFTAFAPKQFVEYMVAVAVAHPAVMRIPEFLRELTRYALYMGIYNKPFGKSNIGEAMNFDAYAIALCNAASDIERLRVPAPAIAPTLFTPERILSVEYSVKGLRYAGILDLMYGKRRDGKFTVDLFGYDPEFSKRYESGGEKQTGRHRFEEHHLIPKTTTRAGGVDSIANIVMLSRAKNSAISNQRFESYLKSYYDSLAPQAQGEMVAYLEQNLIPRQFIDRALAGESFTSDDYEALLFQRATNLAAYINDYFGVVGSTVAPVPALDYEDEI